MLRNEIAYHRWRAACEARAALRSRHPQARLAHERLSLLHAARANLKELDRTNRLELLHGLVEACRPGFPGTAPAVEIAA